MKFYLMGCAPNCYGSHSILRLIPEFILTDAGSFGSAIVELTIKLNFLSSEPPRPTLEGLYAQYLAYRQTLPKVEFRRSRGKASIAVASELIDGADWFSKVVSAALFRDAFAETVTALGLLKLRLKVTDDFSLSDLLEHCRKRESYLPKNDEAAMVLKSELSASSAARRAALSPWERLDIDWKDFHPDSRRILDNPFYWEQANDLSPHGNDTGADLLSDYRKWLKRNPLGDSLEFYERLLKQWGFSDKDPDQMARRVTDEGAVALAFAEVKLRGVCSPPVADLAKKAVERQRKEVLVATDWPHREDQLRSLDLIEAKLRIVS